MNAHVDVTNKLSTRQHKLLALADFIENSSRFSMAQWGCCIAGKCADMIGEDRDEGYVAKDFLGLSDREAFALFTPKGGLLPEDVRGDELEKLDKQWAVATLRHFAFTGNVDWIAARPDWRWKRPDYTTPIHISAVPFSLETL